jgi:uncharacterized protein (TIGR02246 family)
MDDPGLQDSSTAGALRFHQHLLAAPGPAGTVEERLARVEAERAVRDLLVAYSVHYDAGDLEGVVALFAEDAVLRNLLGEHRGRDEIRANYAFLIKHMGASMHFVSNMTVRIDTPTSARAACYLHSIASRRVDGYTYATGGTYSDRLELSDGRWQIVERLTTGTIPYDLVATDADYDRFAASREQQT